MAPENGWSEYKREVVSTLEHHGERLDRMETCMNKGFTEVHVQIAKLSVRSGLATFIAGAVMVAVVSAVVRLVIGS